MTRDRKYFAAADAQSIGAKLVEKVEQYDKHDLVRFVDQKLATAYHYYYDTPPVVMRGGDQGELAEVRINHSRALVNALLNLIVAPKLVWTPRAASLNYKSVRQTELASSVLEHFWHNKQVATYCTQAVEEAIAFTEGFVLAEWDPMAGAIYAPDPTDDTKVIRTGDIRFTSVSSWDVIRDPNKKSWRDLDWVIVRVWRNRYDLAARHPELAESILAADSDVEVDKRQRSSTSRQGPDTDDVPVYLFFHRPCAALPWGREVRFLANKTVLTDERLEYDSIPLHRVSPSELIGTPYGYSAHLEILGVQELSDSIHSAIATNITTFGVQSISVEEGTSLQVDDLAGGMRVLYRPPNSEPPQPLQLTKSPPEAFQYLKDLKAYQELLMGLNAVVRGEAQSDRLSGSALALLQSQALQQASALQGNYVQMVQALGTTVIQIIRRRATVPLKISIVGRQKLNLVREASISADELSQVDEVFVEVGNPISQTAAGRFELAQQLVQMQMVRSPEQLQQVLETGRLDPLTHSTREELVNILRENEDISQGSAPRAMLHDNHLLHGKEHTAPVASPEARKDPSVLSAYTAHMHEHYSLYYGVPPEMVETDPLYRDRMLILTGQNPPPPMAPPMPPGMPPPGPETGPGSPPGPGPAPDAPPEALAPPAPGTAPGPAQPPMQPENPATGQRWNAVDGGGAVPR